MPNFSTFSRPCAMIDCYVNGGPIVQLRQAICRELPHNLALSPQRFAFCVMLLQIKVRLKMIIGIIILIGRHDGGRESCYRPVSRLVSL